MTAESARGRAVRSAEPGTGAKYEGDCMLRRNAISLMQSALAGLCGLICNHATIRHRAAWVFGTMRGLRN